MVEYLKKTLYQTRQHSAQCTLKVQCIYHQTNPSWTFSSSSSSLTIPSSMLSILSLCPSRYRGPLCVLRAINKLLGIGMLSPNSCSLASFSMTFARQYAKLSRDLWTSAVTWTVGKSPG